MASLTITIPDDKVTALFDSFAAELKYDPATDGTKADFAKAKIIGFLKNVVITHDARSAQLTAFQDVQNTVNAIDIT